MSTNDEVLQMLPNDAVRSALLEIIHNNIPTKNYTLQTEKGSSIGDNYVGIVHRLIISYEESDNKGSLEPKKMSIFVKVPPDNIQRRNQFFARPCFLRESLMYDEFLPLLVKFQENKSINTEKDGFKEHAICYKTLTDDLQEAIFMEDLAVKGFCMNDRFVHPSLDIVKLIMRALGKLHALSFALKDQCPEEFAKFRDIEEIFERSDKFFVDYMNGLKTLACDALSKEGDEENLEMVQTYFQKKPIYNQVRELLDSSRAEPYAVVCHGDCWNNNILFKFENGKAIDIKLIDWQISRFASPVCDLSYYIFCCTSKSFRDEYYQEILDVYYSELDQFLKRLGSDPSVLFPRSIFEDQLKKFGSFGMVMGLMLIPTLTTKPENVPDLDDLSAKMEAGDLESTKEAFENKVPETLSRIRDVVIDMIKLKYLE
ncbi:uncharacterized protein LOC129911893 [Episyrphus balteatus]|uniref:uncharacterized protein LOC129911893 n=1 Tax=Episyrphus balteatus TaxID=286459 RepID=UPI002485A8DE|nr:uncharacterized protein LOC129911893 [Episyrphus balteatus]XP_055845869.1 uncharacterized protein LOC129911893 [Episyrphus balteatus]